MSLFRRISNLFFRSRVDREIEAELKAHIELRMEDSIAEGMSTGEARIRTGIWRIPGVQGKPAQGA
jgi:hypothetical protein